MAVPAAADDDARRRVRRVAVQVFALEIVTLIALWVLGALFGRV